MAEKIKQFIQKKKLDAKFARAGSGHRLDEESPRPKLATKDTSQLPNVPKSEAATAAGTAALTRHDKSSLVVNQSAQVYDDYKASRAIISVSTDQEVSKASPSPVIQVSSSSTLTVCMICPVCQKSIPEEKIKIHIHECLQEEYNKEPLSSSVHMIHTLCKDEDQKRLCIDTICRYLDNVISNPADVKYRKIRINNKAFQDRVCCITGGSLFLEAVGFLEEVHPYQDGVATFYVLPDEVAMKTDELTAYKDLLQSTFPLQYILDRDPQLFKTTAHHNYFDLPESFYNMSVDEIKREQKLRAAAVEKESMLRTRAMREKDETKSVIKYYRFILIRVRFPEGVLLQGVFCPLDQLSDIRKLVVDHLIDPTRLFNLHFLRETLSDNNATLARLGLAPAVVLNLSWEDNKSGQHYELVLKHELVQKLKILSL